MRRRGTSEKTLKRKIANVMRVNKLSELEARAVVQDGERCRRVGGGHRARATTLRRIARTEGKIVADFARIVL